MNNLKTARKAAGLTQAEVAAQIGISQNAYSYWENGKVKIDNESLVKLARLFGKTTDYLMGITEHTDISVVSIPVLGAIPAGIPLEAIEDIIDYEELPRSMLSGGKEYFALQVKGDSMYPEFFAGRYRYCPKNTCLRIGGCMRGLCEWLRCDFEACTTE